MFRPDKFYHDQNIDLISDRAVSIDRAARKVLLASGARSITAIWCWRPARAIACSTFPTPISTDVRYLRTLDESEALRHRIAPGQRVVVIGAGFIGLEFAATARAKGLEVDVVELGTAGDGARGDRGNLGIFSGAAHRGRHSHSSRRAGHQHRERRRQGHRRQPQRRPAYAGRPRRGRRRRAAQCRTGGGGRPAGRVRHHRRRASADLRSRTSRRSAIARCLRARASAARCGWSRCRTPPITRAASRRG